MARFRACCTAGFQSCLCPLAGVGLPRALLEARALLGLMASYEAARACSNCSVMARIVASDTSDDGALQSLLHCGISILPLSACRGRIAACPARGARASWLDGVL